MQHNRFLVVALTAVSLAACQSSSKDTEPASKTASTPAYPDARATLRFAATTGSQAAPGLAPAAFAGVTITTAQLVASSVNFKGWESDDDHESSDDDSELETEMLSPGEDDGSEKEAEDEGENDEGSDDVNEAQRKSDEVDFKGPYIVDLLTGVSSPSITAVTLPAGSYSSLEFKLESIESEDDEGTEAAEAAGLLGASVFISGSLQVNGAWTPFDLTDRRDEEVKWAFPAPISVTAGKTNDIVLAIPLDNWMNASMIQAMTDLVTAGDVTGSTLHFSSDQDTIAHALEANFEDAGEVRNEQEHEEEDESE